MLYYTFENNKYYLKDLETSEVVDEMDEVSILFDVTSNVLHKHGNPEFIQKIFNDWKKKCKNNISIYESLLRSFLIITGKFPVEELNKCLTISDYIGTFYKNLLKNDFEFTMKNK